MQKIHSFLSVIILFVFSASQLKAQNLDKEIKEIVEPLVASISNQPVKNVAISDFTLLDGTPTELGKYLAEEFSLSLINAKKSFIVIDRSRVTALLKENNLGGSGLIDPNTIAKLGKMKGIDALIAGTLTSTGNTIRLIVKVWNLESQGLVAGNKGDISKTPFIMELEGKVVSGEASSNVVAQKPRTQLPNSAKVEDENFIFTLKECKKQGENLQISLFITPKEQDRKIDIIGNNFGNNSTIAYDNYNNEYKVKTIKIANKVFGVSGAHGQNLIKDVSTEVILIFNDFKSNANMISLLQISLAENGTKKTLFRNISLK